MKKDSNNKNNNKKTPKRPLTSKTAFSKDKRFGKGKTGEILAKMSGGKKKLPSKNNSLDAFEEDIIRKPLNKSKTEVIQERIEAGEKKAPTLSGDKLASGKAKKTPNKKSKVSKLDGVEKKPATKIAVLKGGVTKEEKVGMHPKNPLRFKYDFKALIETTPELAEFVGINEYKRETIDFSNPDAVKVLNKALLKYHYEIEHWDIPQGYLCPPVPGRADYLHHVADLLRESNKGKLPDGTAIRVLDTGTGANCIYPIVGNRTFRWKFVGSEIDPLALKSAQKIVSENKNVTADIEIREQAVMTNIFNGIIQPDDVFDLTVCNPPFFNSVEKAAESNERKQKNLDIDSSHNALNFGGQNTEFWTKGGEKAFIQKMIKQSMQFGKQCFWFTTLVSKSRSLPYLYKRLEQAQALSVKTIDIAQGQKTSRIVCWTFLSKNEQKEWRLKRWQ